MYQQAFILDAPVSNGPVITAAHMLSEGLSANVPITRERISHIFASITGGSDADKAWSLADGQTAVEIAMLLCLRADNRITPSSQADEALEYFQKLDGLTPRPYNRTEEQVRLQQFSTPLGLAWLAARAAALTPSDMVLEPSAGTGLLAYWAKTCGAKLALNEIDPVRCEALQLLFPRQAISSHDGELIDELLDPSIVPTALLINPPYSVGLERGNDVHTGARHLRSALARLAAGGRAVAIMPEWFDAHAFLQRSQIPLALRLNLALPRAFLSSGTSITTRLIVIDKIGPTNPPVTGTAADLGEALDFVDALPPRPTMRACALLPTAKRVALRLTTASPRTILAPPSPKSAPQIMPISLDYVALSEPAPISEQVGHYLPYRPSRIAIPEACPHPTQLVESVAMGSIAAPVPIARPMVSQACIDDGLLSEPQLETLIYAVNAFERDLPGTYVPTDKGCSIEPSADGKAYRCGYFLGDGTGAGKGRQLASIIMDRWLRGERRHIWLSKNEALLEDARRDWSALGGLPLDVQPLSQWKLGNALGMSEGIVFVTYPTLRSGRVDATRLDQLLDWAGDDFDGVIAFDEAHAMANAAGGEGSRGKVKGSEQGIAGVRLQNLLPRARVIYASATGASDVNNLAYASRLGLWGSETAFATRDKFVSDIRAGGIAAMELVARDLKSLGLYTARALSFAGVEYEILEHELTEAQIRIYDAYADAWAIIHANLSEVLEATRIVDADSGATLNKGAKAAALSIFEGTKQRFFAQLLLSMKLPSLLPAISQALGDGHSAVVQLVSTAEAMLNRRLVDLDVAERENLEIDLSPREYVIDYLTQSFPVRLMQIFVDENGDARSEPMNDADGNPVLCRAALAARDTMIEQLCALPPIATALDAIIECFGVDAVAEVTGRTRRLIIGSDGSQKLQSRSARSNILETQAFMDGDKRILVFSDAGGTGRSYHADLGARNQSRRIHFLLEPGWRADAAIQGLGRTNRTNQLSAPLFRPVTTDVRGERRFISTIARRLDSLGALTRGQRQTGGQNLFDPADNLESGYAKDALNRWFHLLYEGKIQAIDFETFQKLSGLNIEASDGGLVDDLPPIQRWLNRILAFPIHLQNAVFDEFLGLVEARVAAARDAGTLDLGVETIAVEDFRIHSDLVLRTDAATDATTHLLDIEITRKQRPQLFDTLARRCFGKGKAPKYVCNGRSGKVALLLPTRGLITDAGERIDRFIAIRPLRDEYLTADQLTQSNWTDIDLAGFEASWRAETAEAIATPKSDRLFLATGLLLPVWDKLPDDFVRVSRIAAADGRTLLGREISQIDLTGLSQKLGLDLSPSIQIDEVADLVLKTGKALPLSSIEPLMLKRSLVNGSQRLELTGWSAERLAWYKAQGCFTEIIRYQTRLFLPLAGANPVLACLANARR
jgi:P-loop containing NTP hydrolase pore-1/C-terminal domain on Strawberry notch homologue